MLLIIRLRLLFFDPRDVKKGQGAFHAGEVIRRRSDSGGAVAGGLPEDASEDEGHRPLDAPVPSPPTIGGLCRRCLMPDRRLRLPGLPLGYQHGLDSNHEIVQANGLFQVVPNSAPEGRHRNRLGSGARHKDDRKGTEPLPHGMKTGGDRDIKEDIVQ